MPSKSLGKGLEALISSHSMNDAVEDGLLLITDIIPNNNQPRKKFDEQEMKNLAVSIKNSGIIQPLTVRALGDGKYELIAGERRLRAAKSIGMDSVPVYILSVESDIEMMEYALIENIQRVNLNPIEEAEAYAILSGKYKLKHDEISKRVGKKRSTIANSLRLLKLPQEIKLGLKNGKITAGHARAILSLRKSLHMKALYQKIINKKLNVRQTEELAKKYLDSEPVSAKNKNELKNTSKIVDFENKLISLFGTKVTIKRIDDCRGNIKIEFYSNNDLNRFYDILIDKSK